MTNKMPNLLLVYKGDFNKPINPANYDVFNTDTGEKLLNVKEVSIKINRRDYPEVTVTYLGAVEYRGPVTEEIIESTDPIVSVVNYDDYEKEDSQEYRWNDDE